MDNVKISYNDMQLTVEKIVSLWNILICSDYLHLGFYSHKVTYALPHTGFLG